MKGPFCPRTTGKVLEYKENYNGTRSIASAFSRVSLIGISAIEETSSVMRKAVGPMRFHAHFSHSGPPCDTLSVWTKERERLRNHWKPSY